MAGARRPNVLLIVVDDQRFDTIGALGNAHIRTPALDRLASEGTAVTRHFTMVPICTPARAAILTGCDGFANGVRWFGERTDPALVTLPAAFSAAGYRTFFTGKWHNDGHPAERGFAETRRVFLGGMADHEMTLDDRGTRATGFSTDLFADATQEFVQGAHDRPWLAVCAFTSPHDPRTPPAVFDTYAPDTLPLPPSFLPEHPFDNGEMTIRDELLERWPRTPAAIRRHLADYYGMISHHDRRIGDLLDALGATGQRENTLVVFTGDHGLAIGSHGLMGKENLYDHSVRKPLLLSGPGVPAGARIDALTTDEDLLPTLCDLCGIPAPETARGHSLAPLLRGETGTPRDAVFGAYRDVMRSVRTDRWKLIHYPRIDRTQLFDLETDPDELVDLLLLWRWRPNEWYHPPTDGEATRAVAADLRTRLGEWQHAAGDPIVLEE